MAIGSYRTVLVTGTLIVASLGCAHRGPDPFVYGPPSAATEKGNPPPCFRGPLADCVVVGLEQSSTEPLNSPWSFPFQPDLNHRLCRGDSDAQERMLNAARKLAEDENLTNTSGAMLALLSDCLSPAFCQWTLTHASDTDERPEVRDLFLEAARRGCSTLISPEQLDRAASDLGRTPSTEHPWVSNSQQQRCADFKHPEDPWLDLETTHLAGCLDLGEWLQRHQADPVGSTDALERCTEKHEIRYREADCLRELAGLDRRRAVDWLGHEERRGFGRSSTINRYARVLHRFPIDGQLEGELDRLGLIPKESMPTLIDGHAPVLASEILESYGRLVRFSPACPVRYCEHAPLMYRLATTAGEHLDDLIIEERWPALERVDLGHGPRAVSTTVGAIPVTFHVLEGDESNNFDKQHYDRLRQSVEQALAEPHEIRVYTNGRVYGITVRNLGEWYDLETILGGLNTILADRGSDVRLVTLEPYCIPCAQVLAGPRQGLIEAAFDGLIAVVDPFRELWTLPNFDATLLQEWEP